MPGPNLETGLIEPGDGSYYCRCTSRNGSHPVCYEVNKDFRMRSMKFIATAGLARSGPRPGRGRLRSAADGRPRQCPRVNVGPYRGTGTSVAPERWAPRNQV